MRVQQMPVVSGQEIEGIVNNKGLEKGDKVTIFGKEVNKKKVIAGGAAIATACVVLILALSENDHL